ncbi:MAG: glycerol-3-phosphate 1-O-acyltransferase PlsY [Lentisphaerota bacterium]
MNSDIIAFLLIGIASYLFGSVPWAFIIGRLNGIDIRKKGSGNVGATNVMRVLGRKWGIMCFVLDFLKGFLPVLAVKILISQKILTAAPDALVISAGLAAVAGHIWSVFLKFKGGKGMATGGGVLVGIAPYSFICTSLLWIVLFYSTRYVSAASVIAAAALPLSAFIFSKTGLWSLSAPFQIFLLVLAIVTIAKHHSNIKRLMNGTEHKFEKKKG